mmetsp:Transcript_17799/g.40301  ORF Transcript_17799/g.40301 Transcript_17799/m.40301 type:complete len:160 (-) Transcript_17799:675-1154(-)
MFTRMLKVASGGETCSELSPVPHLLAASCCSILSPLDCFLLLFLPPLMLFPRPPTPLVCVPFNHFYCLMQLLLPLFVLSMSFSSSLSLVHLVCTPRGPGAGVPRSCSSTSSLSQFVVLPVLMTDVLGICFCDVYSLESAFVELFMVLYGFFLLTPTLSK